jgi:hypothetical protein
MIFFSVDRREFGEPEPSGIRAFRGLLKVTAPFTAIPRRSVTRKLSKVDCPIARGCRSIRCRRWSDRPRRHVATVEDQPKQSFNAPAPPFLVIDEHNRPYFDASLRASAGRVGDETDDLISIRGFDNGKPSEWSIQASKTALNDDSTSLPSTHRGDGRLDSGHQSAALSNDFVMSEQLILLLFIERLPIIFGTIG